MKLLVAMALVLAIASAFDLREAETNSSSVVVPGIKKEGRIYNGKTATEGQFPYQVGVVLKLEKDLDGWCGGSLIGLKWVLTAAHCVTEVRSVIVHLGALARTKPKVSFDVSEGNFIIHPKFQKATASNDIALIKIPPVTLSRTIQVVKLPPLTGSYSSYKNKHAFVSGWGRTSGSVQHLSEDLQYALMQVIDNGVCKSAYGKSITSKKICASGERGASICAGDSGDPLVLKSEKVQIGLTTFGGADGCGYPSVFVRVTKYLEWIYFHTGIVY